MAINIFEGSRRVVLFVQGLVIAAGIWVVTQETTTPSVSYITVFPTEPFLNTHGKEKICDYSRDATESIYGYKLQNGKSVTVNLCFLASLDKKGDYRIPYKVENNLVYSDTQYSTDVTIYTKARTHSFKLTPKQDREAQESTSADYKQSLIKNARSTSGFCITIIFAIELLKWLTGWIARGFLNIPNGKDRSQR